MKRLLFALATAAGLLSTACGGGSSVQPPPPVGKYSMASLNGQYAFVTNNRGYRQHDRHGRLVLQNIGSRLNMFPPLWRDFHRNLPLKHGIARRIRAVPLSERHRAGRVGHPFPAGSIRR